MSQYWRIINLDKRETTRTLGQLGQIFFQSPQYFFLLLTRPPNETSDRRIGSWAGDRIICVGDHSDSYPESILTDEEIAFLKKGNTNLFSLAKETYKTIDPFLNGRVPRQCQVESGDSSGAPASWMIRNLTKKEFADSDYIEAYMRAAGVTQYGSHPLVATPGLAHVMMLNIAWSSDPSSLMRPYRKKLTQGAWAGDRFDVVLADSFDVDDETVDWLSVSDDMAKELAVLYEPYL